MLILCSNRKYQLLAEDQLHQHVCVLLVVPVSLCPTGLRAAYDKIFEQVKKNRDRALGLVNTSEEEGGAGHGADGPDGGPSAG